MKRFRSFVFTVLTGALLAGCCSKEKPPTLEPVLTLNPADTRFFSTDGTYTFEVTTDQDSWEARSDKEWCVVTPDYAGGAFTVELNGGGAPAHAVVTVKAGAAAPVAIDFARLQDFDKNFQISYPQQDQAYALIVAPSSGWENYRYQAGAYLIYKMLKDNGMDDDHIVLVSEDDIARNPNNPTPGRILPPEGDGNLYENVTVDYKPSELGFSELADILHSKISPNDNLFIYWAGEASPQGPKWLGETLPVSEVVDFLVELHSRRFYRKLFFVLETDYSGAVGKAAEGIPGILCFAAADGETSKGGVRTDAAGKIPLSNSFTDAFYNQAVANKNISLYDLYVQISRTMPYYTCIGVYNAIKFGNLYTSSVNEFLNP